jgi:hypothetical protein
MFANKHSGSRQSLDFHPQPLMPSSVLNSLSGRQQRDRQLADRRSWLKAAIGAGTAAWASFPSGATMLPQQALSADSDTRVATKLLVRPSGLNSLETRAKVAIELDGTLHWLAATNSGEQSPRKSDVRATSTLDYFEKIALENSGLLASARRYVEAQSQNWISGKTANLKLRPECAETRMLKHEGTWQQFCEDQTLDLREAQLLRSPINTALLEWLLPTEPAKPESSWKLDNAAACELFNLEAVHQSSLSARILSVRDGIATMELSGNIEGTANSVTTRMQISGSFRAQATGSCVLVTWVGLAIEEKREISQAEPGFEVKARVRVLRDETDTGLTATHEQLKALAREQDAGRWLVQFQSPAGHFRLLADRKWRTYADSAEESVLRMIENDTVIAQCNISPLPSLEEGKQWTLEGMQADIKKTLGDRFEQFLEARESLTASKLRLLRCVVIGSTEDVPIQWIYNQLSDDSGRRVAVVFTMGGNMTDRFAAADEQMTASFEWLPLPDQGKQPTPAPSTPHAPVERRAEGPARSVAK